MLMGGGGAWGCLGVEWRAAELSVLECRTARQFRSLVLGARNSMLVSACKSKTRRTRFARWLRQFDLRRHLPVELRTPVEARCIVCLCDPKGVDCRSTLLVGRLCKG